jgi:hypothetical protein
MAASQLTRINSMADLLAWADRLGVETENRDAWCIVDECMDRDPLDCTGLRAEYVRMGARMAVRNADPSYRGYTPFGDIS